MLWEGIGLAGVRIGVLPPLHGWGDFVAKFCVVSIGASGMIFGSQLHVKACRKSAAMMTAELRAMIASIAG